MLRSTTRVCSLIIGRAGRGDPSGSAAYPAADQADARDLTISELTACIARLEDQVNKLASGSSSKDTGHFTGTCHYCKKQVTRFPTAKN